MENRQQRTATDILKVAGAKAIVLNPTNGTGEPDIVGALNGTPFAIELKQPGEQPTRIQREMLRQWAQAGAVTSVASTASDVRRVITECRYQARDSGPGSPRRVVPSETHPEQETL